MSNHILGYLTSITYIINVLLIIVFSQTMRLPDGIIFIGWLIGMLGIGVWILSILHQQKKTQLMPEGTAKNNLTSHTRSKVRSQRYKQTQVRIVPSFVYALTANLISSFDKLTYSRQYPEKIENETLLSFLKIPYYLGIASTFLGFSLAFSSTFGFLWMVIVILPLLAWQNKQQHLIDEHGKR